MRGKIVIRPSIAEHSVRYDEATSSVLLDDSTLDELTATIGFPLIFHADSDADIFIAYDTGMRRTISFPLVSI